MCYTILVVERYCTRKHIHAATLCWRQCKTQAVLSYETSNWRRLCKKRQRAYDYLKAWYPREPQENDPICKVCLSLEADREARDLRNFLEPLQMSIKKNERAIEEQEDVKNKLEDALIADATMNESLQEYLANEYVVLCQNQQAFRAISERSLARTKEWQKVYTDIERRYEKTYCDPVVDRAVSLFNRSSLIYMGRPSDVELERADCPRHLLRCNPETSEILVC